MIALRFEKVHGWIEPVLGLVFPNLCQICQGERATAPEGYVCHHCSRNVRFIQPPFCQVCGLPYFGAVTESFECSNCADLDLAFAWARAAVVANPLLLEIIHHYKYRRALWFEPFLAGALTRAAGPVLSRTAWDWIVPVPLHPLRKREREFNQAERLGEHLSRATGIPLRRGLLRRVLATETQTHLSRRARTANVARAFEYEADERLRGDRLVLVDDVLTTGSTTSACARVLVRNGAGPICVWTVARGLLT